MRKPSTIVYISDLLNGTYIEDEKCLVTLVGERIYRCRILGTVIDKREYDESRYGFIVLEDSSGIIRAKFFDNVYDKIKNINIGDIVEIIGRPRKRDEEIYVATEIVRIINDINYELLRELELCIKYYKLGKSIEEKPRELKVEDLKTKVLNAIEMLDEGEGADFYDILNETKIDEEKLEEIINELLTDGEIYMPKINKFKKI